MASARAEPAHACKATWTAEEDERLDRLVLEFGSKRWAHISRCLGSRTGKQCRERWRNHLDPLVRKDPFTPKEDATILAMVDKVGTRWSAISNLLPGRTDNAVKNRYNSALKKLRAKHEPPKSPVDKEAPAHDTPVVSQSPPPHRGKGDEGEGVASTPNNNNTKKKKATAEGSIKAAAGKRGKAARPKRQRQHAQTPPSPAERGSSPVACSEASEGRRAHSPGDWQTLVDWRRTEHGSDGHALQEPALPLRPVVAHAAVVWQPPPRAWLAYPHIRAWSSMHELAQLERSAAAGLCALRGDS